MNQETYRKLISGQSEGASAAIAMVALRAISSGYTAAIGARNFLYSRGWFKKHRANAIVISIGNITVGGTGKTPLVIWMYRFLQNKNILCAILTRGYKARGTSDEGRATRTDEPAMLAGACPGARVIVNPNRVAGAAKTVDKFGAEVVIMDDGFQHRRLHRDLDIVTIDATCPFGYGRMLPAGLLREPVISLKRADAVVITRCEQTNETALSELKKRLQQINPAMAIAKSVHTSVCARVLGGEEIGIEELGSKKIFAFCGIGNPDAFLNTVRRLGANLVGSKIYNDHHHYSDDDISDIYEEAGYLNADLILSTQKDWTKTVLPASALAGANKHQQNEGKHIPFAYLAVELKFVNGEDKITQLLENVLAGKILSD